jgi:DNA-binding NarL/FixJ family response regulator
VLVEHPDEAAGLEISAGLRFAGYAVAVCPGPRGRGQCPLTGPAGCAPVHDADVVVCSLGYEREAAREVLRELRTRYPRLPLVVEVPSDVDAGLHELLEGCRQLPAPATPEQIVAAVRSLAAEGGRAGGEAGVQDSGATPGRTDGDGAVQAPGATPAQAAGEAAAEVPAGA